MKSLGQKKFKDKSPDEVNRILSDAWLNIVVSDENKLFNPLTNMPDFISDQPHLYYTWLMSQPEYFSFLCSEILNVNILPIQAVILTELWTRKFPMLIGSRGLGKSCPINTPVLLDHGWSTIGEVRVGDKIYARDGKLHTVTQLHPQGKLRVCKLKLFDGREIECSEDHLWVVKKGSGKERVLTTKEIINNGLIWVGPSGKHAYKYKIPQCNPIEFNNKELKLDPYILGCLLGDGCMTTRTPKIASDDQFIIEEFRSRLKGFKIEKDPTNNNYTIVDLNKDYSDFVSRAGNTYKQRSRNRLTTLIEEMGLNVGCSDKFIPDEYKYSSVEDRLELVRGLMDTDGCANISSSIEFTNTCEKLVDDLIEVLRSLGISCIKSQDNREGQEFIPPQGGTCIRGACYRVYINTSKPIFKLPRKLDRLKTKPTGREDYVAIVEAYYTDEYTEMQCLSVDSDDHTYITKDFLVTHNCLESKTLVKTKDTWKQIKDLEVGERVYSSDGRLYFITAKTDLQENLNFYRIYLDDGREIDCCEDHTWTVLSSSFNSSFSYNISAKQLFSQLISEKKEIFLPINDPLSEDTEINHDIDPYLMGAIFAHGYVSGSKIYLKIFSPDLIDFLKTYKSDLITIDLIEENSGVCTFTIDAPILPICKMVEECDIPEQYSRGSLSQRMQFFKGATSQIFRDKGKIIVRSRVKFVNFLTDVARSCGYHCYNKGYKSYFNTVEISELDRVRIRDMRPIGKSNGYCIEVNSPDHTYIIKDYIVTHNSFILGLYSIIRALLLPKRKIVICGAAFRQSKVVYEYASGIWNNSPLLRDIIGTSGNNGPRNMTDMCRLTLKDSMISALPIGCLTPDTYITTDSGIKQMGDFNDAHFPYKIFSNKSFEKVGFFFDNGEHEAIQVTTDMGFQYTGTPNHKMKVLSNNDVVWKRTDELQVGDQLLINTGLGWPEHTKDITDKLAIIKGRYQDIVDIGSSTKVNAQQFLISLIYHNSYKKDEKIVISLYNNTISNFVHYLLLHFGIMGYKKDNKIVITEQDNRKIEDMVVGMINLDRVKSINNVGIKYTVDLNIPTNNTYTANGFISHNTGDKIRGQRASDILSDEFSCLRADTLVQTQHGLLEIKDYLDGEVYELKNENGEFEQPERIFITPKTDVYEVKTAYGYKFYCSEKHKVKTIEGYKLGKDLTKLDFLEMEFCDYFPSRILSYGEVDIDDRTGWLLGLLVSEGTVTNRNNIIFSNTDIELINSVKDRFSDFDWKEHVREAYVDNRGWNCKKCYNLHYNSTEFRTGLFKAGLGYCIAKEKTIPKSILCSPRSVVLEFLSGLYEGDGSCFFSTAGDREKDEFQVVMYSSSSRMLEQLQTLLLKFSIYSSINDRGGENYRLVTRGNMAIKLFHLLDVLKWKDITPPEPVVSRSLQVRQNPKGKYIASTSRANKNKHLGSFDTLEECQNAYDKFWSENREVLRVTSVKKLDEQEVLYDFYMPKTNSFIGNGFIQHNSIPREIFETVIAGFAAVSADPANNVREQAKRNMQELLGLEIDEDVEGAVNLSNQICLSGTAYYDFNHFATYWKKWREIILSRGDKRKLEQIFKGEIPENFDWRDYSIMRMPYTLLPEGFMDGGQIARSKATIHTGIFFMEFLSIFCKDSDGFYKRSLLESCTVTTDKTIYINDQEVIFDAMVKGLPGRKYVYAVDPASESDNFSIVILERHSNHRRIVYSWTTNRKEHIEKVKARIVSETDFYSYCAKKIRELMRTFEAERIAIDAGGGGIAIIEALHDKDKMLKDELPIWEVIETGKEKQSDGNLGLHIIVKIQFASADFTSESNHGMRKDFEDKVLLFPFFNAAALSYSIEEDNIANRKYDTLEDCMLEIEEMKNELTTIVITQTSGGREHWDTPEVKLPGHKKGKLRKDRYSSLLMANYVARNLARAPESIQYDVAGGFAESSKQDVLEGGGGGFIGAQWIVDAMDGLYD